MTKINYVVALWGGRPQCEVNVRLHIDLLNGLKNSVSQVTLVSPAYSDRPNQKFEKMLEELDGTTLANGANVVVLRRNNNSNISYGSWSDAYGVYRDQFDYYIFLEDDYIPARPFFDTILVSILESKQCHYLCMLVSNTKCISTITGVSLPHAGVTVGMCKSTAMEVIWEKYGSLLSNDFQDWYWHNQMNFSYPYGHCDFKIDDFSDQYAVPFWHQNAILDLVSHNQYLIVPQESKDVVIYD